MDIQDKTKEELQKDLMELQSELFIVNQKQSESLEANQYLDNLFNYANAPIIVWNIHFEIIRFNKAFETLTGRLEKEVIGQSIEILFPPVNRETSMKLLEQTLKGERLQVVEINILHLDGSISILLWNSANIMSPDGKTSIAAIAQGYDITKRIQSELELKEKNEQIQKENIEKEKRAAELILAKEKAEEFESKFKQIAENIDEVFWLRTDSEMIYVSPLFEKIWGVPCEAIYKNPHIFTEKIFPEDKTVFQEIIDLNEFKERKLFEYEFRIMRADNQVCWIVAKTVPIIDDAGKIIKRVGVASDITEKHQSVQELILAKEHAEESDRLKSAFLANMSHEIRTPMNGILGFSELLKTPGLTGEQQQKYIKIIEKSGARMLNIINNIVDISKIEANLMNVDLHETDINEKIEFIYLFFKPEVEEKGMQLIIKNTLPEKEATIRTDSEKVYSILTNLVKNAIKYSHNGVIEFGYKKKDNFLEFYVKDTGIGIPKDRQVAIFERFIQADISDKMAQQGAGLGLSISKAYVEMLGGKIWVESEEGKGSTFYFTLPYNTVTEEKMNVGTVFFKQDEKNQIKNLKILIAEDDETSKLLVSITVKDFSKEIFEARTGSDAVEIYQKNMDIDLILMDIQMPVMNGYEATRQIRKLSKEVVIIAQTAFGLVGDRQKAMEAGSNDFISKPINKVELISLLQKYFKK